MMIAIMMRARRRLSIGDYFRRSSTEFTDESSFFIVKISSSLIEFTLSDPFFMTFLRSSFPSVVLSISLAIFATSAWICA